MHLGLVIAAAARAADYDVSSGGPYTSVAAAVAQATADAGDGHVVRILDLGPYVEAVTVTEAMTIRGEGVVPLLRPNDPDAGFFTIAAPGAVVTISGVELDGQGAGRAIQVRQGGLWLAGVVVHDTASATGPGGAVLFDGDVGDTLTITDSTFTASSTLGDDGGAVAMMGGDLVILRSTFTGGSAGDDGGHIAILTGSGSDLLVEDSTFRDGRAADSGGALYLRDGDVQIRRTRFESSSALGGGGGAFQAEQVLSLVVEDATFDGNDALDGGGAVHQVDGVASYTRSLFCANRSSASGGALYLGAATATVDNGVFLGNSAAVDGGAAYAQGLLLTVRHASLSSNVAGGRGHALAAGAAPALVVADTYFGDHPVGTEAVVSIPLGAATVATSGWWANAGGAWNAETLDLGGNVLGDSLIPPPPVGACDVLLMLPPPGSSLIGAASDGDVGAFGGPSSWPDADADGVVSLLDCDDALATVFPGAPEVPADGVDQDCDLGDVCYVDLDGDGSGEPTLVASPDLGCTDAGEAANPDEACPTFDDRLDDDLDGVPDGCDICAGFPDVPDGDGDLVPDGCDPCPSDNPDDSDGDGLCDGSDPCPDDPGACETGDTGASAVATAETALPTATGDTGATADTADTGVAAHTGDTGATTPPGSTDRIGAEEPAPTVAGCGCATRAPGGGPALLLVLGHARRRRRLTRCRETAGTASVP